MSTTFSIPRFHNEAQQSELSEEELRVKYLNDRIAELENQVGALTELVKDVSAENVSLKLQIKLLGRTNG